MPMNRLYCNTSALFSRVFVLLLALYGVQIAEAQSVSFSSAAATLARGFTDTSMGPQAVAVDKASNVYVADTDGSRVVKITPDGTRSILNTGTLNGPQGIAIDPAGNVYIADSGNDRILEIPASGPAVVFNTGTLTLAQPTGMAVDTSGNLYINDSNNGRIVKVAPDRSASVFNTGSFQVLYGMGLAIDPSGTLYIADTPNNRIIQVTADGTATELHLTASTGETITLNGPQGVAVDEEGNIIIADTYNGDIVKINSSGVASIVNTGNDSSTDWYNAVATEKNGAIYILETDYFSKQSQLVFAQTESVNFGLVNVCQAGHKNPSPCSRTVSLNYIASTPLSSNGSATRGKDFSLHHALRCDDIAYSYGYRCRQNVRFTPTVPGARLGDVELTDDAGNVIATTPVSGTGRAPLLAFLPGVAGQSSTGKVTLGAPTGIALDEAQNRYIVDSSMNQIVKVASDGTAAPVPVTLSLSHPNGIAIDGAGTLYVTDTGSSRVVKVSASGASVLPVNGVSLNQPFGIAMDEAGTIYIADAGNNRIVTIKADGFTSTLATGSLTLSQPHGIAVDAANNIYIADTGNSRIVEVTSNGIASSVTPGAFTLNQPAGLTVDAAGTLYIADQVNSNIVAIAANGNASLLSTGTLPLGSASGITLDAAGNLYIADEANSRIVELDRSTVPSLSFASTALGATSDPQTVTLANIGNAELKFPTSLAFNNPNISADFTLNDSSTCPRLGTGATANGSLAAGSTCTLDVSFAPTDIGSISGSLVVTDNMLHTTDPYAAQIIALSGTSIRDTSNLSIGSSLNPSTFGQPVTFTADLHQASAGSAILFYDGATVIGTSALSANGQAVLTTSALNAGMHSITAQYAGNGTLLPASSNIIAQTVNPASATITWNPPASIASGINLSGVLHAEANVNGSFSYTAKAASGTATIVNASTTLAAGTYTLTANFTPADSIDYLASTLTAPLTVSAATTTATPPAPSFTFSLSTAALNLVQGQSGVVKATLTPENGFRGTVTLSCDGVPALISCAFSTQVLTANGSNTQQTADITISTVAANALASQLGRESTSLHAALAGFWFLPAGILGGWLFWQRRRFQAASKYMWMLVLLLSCTMGMMGCGVNFNPPLPGGGTITVTATAGNGMSQTQTFTLNVTKQ